MPAVYEHRHVVVPSEIDRLGHVNNLAYLAWMQTAAIAHSAAQGWPGERYTELGAGWVVRSHEIKYLEPCYLDEAIVVRTWVADMKRMSSLRRFRIERAKDDRLLAKAATNWAFVDFSTGQLRRIPDEIAGCFELVPDQQASDAR